MKKLLIINAGSSSMKFRVYSKEDFKMMADGLCERIGVDGKIKFEYGNGEEFEQDVTLNNHLEAVNIMIEELKKHQVINSIDEIVGVGHRVVQGGELYKDSVLVDDKAIKVFEELSGLAPLHNPGAVSVLKAFRSLTPEAKNVAVFDTSFHQTMTPEYYLYPVPRSWYEKYGVRRYGMHGTSHKYISQRAAEIMGSKDINIISCHLGNGASLAAIEKGKSINTSMGLTPLPGVMMGTRSGDVDPAIIEYIHQKTNMSLSEITNDLNKKSGVLGLSNVSSDMRDVTNAANEGNNDAKEALDIYARKVANYIVQYQNDLKNKVDAIVFTAGIGENASNVRESIISKLSTLDFTLDQDANNQRVKGDYALISTPDSKTKIYIIKTNEELMIANDLIKHANL